jgi:hypothetical protein
MQSLRKLSLIWAVVLLAAMLIPISDSRSLPLSTQRSGHQLLFEQPAGLCSALPEVLL